MADPNNNPEESRSNAPEQEPCRKFKDLLARTPPHHVIATLLWILGLKPESIVSQFFPKSLEETLNFVESSLEEKNWIGDPLLKEWCGIARRSLGESGNSLLISYFKDKPVEELTAAREATIEIALVAAATSGHRAAFDVLRDRYDKAMMGRIQTHEHGQKNSDEIHRKLWNLAWRELPNFDPAERCLANFFRHQVDLLCLDPSAFEVVHSSLKDMVQQSISKRVFAESNRQDVAQEAWLLFWKQLPKFEPQRASVGQFVAYWTQIAILRSIPNRDNPESDEPISLEDNFSSREEVRIFLSKVFSGDYQPQEVLAFVYNKSLFRAPQFVVEKFWLVPFQKLTEMLKPEWSEVYQFDRTDMENILDPFHCTLVKKQTTGKTFADFAPENLSLKGRAQKINDWANAVLRKEVVKS